ncbi:hypothetical protein J437_LFUL011460 [Ladona fulva]|uniref:Uncharacterized protein n=1 Tax=Ladona fulva TaxID=123851 RepID=A0A8K0KSW1_LADFU|nr:hypothetical protein J437_LFUL011460 [Ladona fulva]
MPEIKPINAHNIGTHSNKLVKGLKTTHSDRNESDVPLITVMLRLHLHHLKSGTNSDNSNVVPRVRKRARHLSSSSSAPSEGDEASASASAFREEWVWEEKDNVPELKQFTEISSVSASFLRRLGNNPKPLQVFEEVLSDDFWEMLSTETNRYVKQVVESEQ